MLGTPTSECGYITFGHLPLIDFYTVRPRYGHGVRLAIFYYDGMSYRSRDELLTAVRNDLDFCVGDSDIDDYLRQTGGAFVNGETVMTTFSLKRSDYTAYREVRNEFLDMIMSEIRDGLDTDSLPIQVPFTFNVIEGSE